MIEYKVEHVCSYAVRGTEANPPEVIGPTCTRSFESGRRDRHALNRSARGL